jgi:hypothetical protein
MAPDYMAPSPLWPQSGEVENLVPASLKERLLDWQHTFDEHVDPESGWDDDNRRVEWTHDGLILAEQLRIALGDRAELELGTWAQG